MPTFASEPPAAFVFDAYGTLFDVHSITAAAESIEALLASFPAVR